MVKNEKNDGLSLTLDILQGLSGKYDLNKPEEILADVRDSLDNLKNNPHRVHGIRVEKMFGYLAKALDNCLLIKQEDSGLFYTESEAVPPDYRLILKEGSEFFVEVKNRHQAIDSTFKITKVSISKLLNYPRVTLENLKIAIYLSTWKMWFLIPIKSFKENENHYFIKITDAFVNNELGLLGEMYFLCVAPLRLEFIADLSKSSEINDKGESKFFLQDIKVFTGKGLVENGTVEREIIFDTIMYGLDDNWNENNSIKLKGNKVEKIIFEYFSLNEEIQPIIGYLSRTITNKFNLATAPEGGIKKLQVSYLENAYKFYSKIPHEKFHHLSVLRMKVK